MLPAKTVQVVSFFFQLKESPLSKFISIIILHHEHQIKKKIIKYCNVSRETFIEKKYLECRIDRIY